MTEGGDLKERIYSRRVAAPEDDADACDDCVAYGFLRGRAERGVMIDFRFLNGNRQAFPYATLDRVVFNPSDGLIVRFLGVWVVLTGRNFAAAQPNGASFLEALHRHRVPWVQEMEELRATLQPPGAVVVTGIEIRE